ncbi:solute carrier family 22 member 7-like [Ornithodoros turicata]|uniref:solute carrier family 22 member 7-like n=1 Tax=Ornithodoros turicata TaxID=34597 RepID=UPI003139C94C
MSSKRPSLPDVHNVLSPQGYSERASRSSSRPTSERSISEPSRSFPSKPLHGSIGNVLQRSASASTVQSKQSTTSNKRAPRSSQSSPALPALPAATERLAIAWKGPTDLSPMSEETTGRSAHRTSQHRTVSTVSSVRAEEFDEQEISQTTIYGHGCFQRMILFCSVLSLVVLQCHGLAFKLIARSVDFWCERPALSQNLSVSDWRNVGIPLEPDGSYSRCNVYDDPFALNKTSIPCTAWEYDTPSVTIISTWDLVCSREWLIWFASVMYTMGAVIAVPLMGMAADQIGRRPVICIAVSVLLLSGFGTCFASNFVLFVCARCIVSGCASTIFVTIFILLLEVTSVEHRALYCMVSASLGVVVAGILIAVLSVFTAPWRVFQAIFMAITCLLVSTFYVVQESPRWLLATCNFRQAKKVILSAARMNGVPQDRVRMLYSKLKMFILRNSECLKISALTLFTNPVLRSRSSLLFICWFSVSFSYYALKMTTVAEEEARWADVASAAAQGPLIVLGYYAINRRGRKTTLALTLGFIGFSSTVLTVDYPTAALHFTNIIVVLARGAVHVAVAVNHIYTAELFPTVMRSVGVCTAYYFGGLGGAAATALTAPHTSVSPHITMAVLTFLMLFAELALVPLPQIRSQPLVNTMKELEELDYKRYLQKTLPEHVGIISPRATRSRDLPRDPRRM